jgi:DNA-binding LytR/AlgR family response regulator
METVKALIVEDKSVVAEDLKLCLEDFGYLPVGVCSTGGEAIRLVESLEPDILLMDINIKGSIDGVETVRQINLNYSLPVIYITAYSDNRTVERAKTTYPSAYLVKPFDPIDLKIAIDIAIENFSRYLNESQSRNENAAPRVRDSFFVKQGDCYQKIAFDHVWYIEADGSYTKIHTDKNTVTLSLNMKNVLANLPQNFLKVHRSFVVNIAMVSRFDRTHLYIEDVAIPVSAAYRDLLSENFLKM